MSFLKELFGKSKDKKYGKGHRLGDALSSATRPSSGSSSTNSNATTSRRAPPAKSEAAMKAGEAALQRLENAKQPRAVSAISRQVAKEIKEDANKQERHSKELEQALKLKEHYFGKPKEVEADSLRKNRILYTAPILPENEKYTINEIDDRIEQLLLEKLHEEPILVACTLLCTANYKDADKLTKCIEILSKFADNILNNPKEEKYRKIRAENQIFKEKVYSCKYSDLVLKQSGFKAVSLKKETPDVTVLDGANDLNMPAKTEDFFMYEGDNMDPLNSLKTFLSLAEPIKPELDRDIKVYRVVEQSTANRIADFDLSEEFYNLKIDELRREQALRNEALEKTGMLRTKAMRERDEQLELRRYNYCLIRVKFPNGLILQAMFKANEKYQDLLDLVNDCLEICDVPFELFSHSIRKAPNLAELTLTEAGLSPASLLNFKLSDQVEEAVKASFERFLSADLVEKIQDFT